MWRRSVACVLVFVWAGCGGSDHDNSDGELNGHCYPNGTCNVGLTCVAGVCLPIDAGMPDAPNTPSDALIDAPSDALMCTTAFEPNDTVQAATTTGVATMQSARTFTGLMICPAGDKDHFEVIITTASTNLEMLVDFDPALSIPQGSILNSGGVAIANAAPVSGMPNRRRAFTPNLPTGTYYAQVYAGQTVASYQLTLTVTGP